jgi:hypothetical protein|tara:strand:- start:1795 stop:1944 length:150 start_codon:yes stop_codon:yes gene_type:complete
METYNESVKLNKALQDVDRLKAYNFDLKMEVIKLKKLIRQIKNKTNEIK